MTVERKIAHLPGTALSAKVVLCQTLEKIAHIKAVTIVIQWDDETFDADWSSMKASELAMASLVLTDLATRTARGEKP